MGALPLVEEKPEPPMAAAIASLMDGLMELTTWTEARSVSAEML